MAVESLTPEPPPEDNGLRPLEWAAWLLVVLGVIALLYAAREFFIPLVLGIVVAYLLRPAVDLLVRFRVPRMLAGLVVILAALGAIGYTAYALRDDAARLLETLPKAARKVRVAIQEDHRNPQPSAINTVREAAKELDKAEAAASGQSQPKPAAAGPTMGERLQDFLVEKGVTFFGLLGQVLFSTLLAWYLLGEGDNFKRKLLRLVGPQLTRKKITVRILDDIDRQIQRQMGAVFVTNALIGLSTTVAFWAIGMEQAILWGVLAGTLHFIPYIGQGIITTAAAAAAYLQFGSAGPAFGVAGLTLFLSITIGTVLMTWLQSRASRINMTVLFVSMLFFAWLWGAWGLVLASPVVVMVKSLCDHIEGFSRIAEFLAGRERVLPSPEAVVESAAES